MNIKSISDILINASRPLDVFGEGNAEDVKRKYKSYIKICHPDLVSDSEKDMAQKVTILLNEYYDKAIKEIKDGIYNIKDEKELLKRKDVLFEVNLRGKDYKFYEYMGSDDVCDIYRGLCEEEEITLRIVIEKSDNELLDKEYEMLNELNHLSLPSTICKLKINDRCAIIYSKKEGLSVKDLKKEYGNLSAEHVCWVLERLLSVTGYLHSHMIVHGNIKEDNILIDPVNHNVILSDCSLCISEANKSDSKYNIINDYYSPDYVSANSRVKPNADIYAVGKIAISLLGGDIQRVALPLSCDVRIRTFIRKLLMDSENDAWELWDELIKLRNEVYGTKKFQILSKIKGGK